MTAQFIKRIRAEGALAKAMTRVKNVEAYEPLSKLTIWALVCEELVDTEYEPYYYERVVAELLRRRIEPNEMVEMRMFAWETAGWLNFEKMLWDWCGLDEGDIERAIAWQLEEGVITHAESISMTGYLNRYRQKSSSPSAETGQRSSSVGNSEF